MAGFAESKGNVKFAAADVDFPPQLQFYALRTGLGEVRVVEKSTDHPGYLIGFTRKGSNDSRN
jgi:hypothetical protein